MNRSGFYSAGSPSPPRLWLLAGAVVLLAAGWLNPTRHLPWSGFYSELPAALAGVLMVLAAATVPGSEQRIGRGAAVALVSGVALPFVHHLALQDMYFGDAFVSAAYVAGAMLCLIAGRHDARCSAEQHVRATDIWAWFFLVVSLSATSIGLAQWLGVSTSSEWIVEGRPGSRIEANVGQSNHVATLLVFGLLSVAYLRASARLSGITTACAVVMLIVGIALTQSRTPLAIAVVLAVWYATRRAELWAPNRIGTGNVGALVMLYGVALWATVVLPGPLLLTDSAVEPRTGTGLRPLLWAQMVHAVALEPWTGYGWLQGLAAQAAAAIDKPGLEYANYAHNIVLDLMVWNGVPLGLLLTGVLIYWYVKAGVRARGHVDSFRFAILTAFAVHSMLEYPFAYAYFLVPVAWLAGELFAAPPSSKRGAVPTRTVLRVGAVVMSLVLFVIARDYLLAEADRRDVQMVMARIGGPRPYSSVPNMWVLDQLEAASAGARLEPRPLMPQKDIADLARTTRRFPSVFFLRSLIAAYALNDRPDDATIELRRLDGLHGRRQSRASIDSLDASAQAHGWAIGPFLVQARRLEKDLDSRR